MLPDTLTSLEAELLGTMVTLDAAVTLPLASSVTCATAIGEPYVPADTPVAISVGFG